MPDIEVDGVPRVPATDGERAQHRRAGAGLGLAITRHLLTLMGGSLTIASDPGAGSTFTAVIPFEEPQPPRREEHRRSAPKGRRALAEHGIAGLRILLAEDNAMNQRVALNLLGRFGCTAEIAHNGVEALAALSRSEYDVVLMDVQMPEMDGIEATREIVRRYAPAARPFIIAMTANTLASDRTACADAGMDDFVSKPVDVQQFRDALQRGLEHVKHRNDKKSGAPADGARDLVDRSVLAQYVTSDNDSSHETLRRVVGMYLMDIPIKLQALNAAMDANDVKSVGYYAHNIQGSFSMLGAMQLAAHCRQLVEECTQNAHARAGSTITRIEREFASVRKVLHDMGLTA
jgi:CheY-like chemotaxis protein/HPt (histidine-containing phosphotransfer) domain-containing protein